VTEDHEVAGSNPASPILSVLGVGFLVDAYNDSDSWFKQLHEYVLPKVLDSAFLGSLPKHELDRIIHTVLAEKKKRFRRRKEKKYGAMNKGFTDEELKKFFGCCNHPKAHLAFRLMSQLGLRIGEVVKIRLQDVDLVKRKLYVLTEKAHTGDFLYLHDEVFELLRAWIDTYDDEIRKNEDYLLYSEVGWNKQRHISPFWLRNEFQRVRLLAGLHEWYGKSDETLDRPQRTLYRLTTHSLRHHFITKVYKTVKDPVTAQKLARHTNIKSTMVYIHATQRDLDESMSRVFEKGSVEKEREQAELKKLLEVWRLVR
jgi:integrase